MATAQLALITTERSWKLDRQTVEVGRAGVARARAILAEIDARRAAEEAEAAALAAEAEAAALAARTQTAPLAVAPAPVTALAPSELWSGTLFEAMDLDASDRAA